MGSTISEIVTLVGTTLLGLLGIVLTILTSALRRRVGKIDQSNNSVEALRLAETQKLEELGEKYDRAITMVEQYSIQVQTLEQRVQDLEDDLGETEKAQYRAEAERDIARDELAQIRERYAVLETQYVTVLQRADRLAERLEKTNDG